MNTVYFIVQQTMLFAIPLLVVSLGGLWSEKSGVNNIGLEGIMIMGAFAGVIMINALQGILPAQLLLIVSIAVAGIAGGIYALLHAWASIRLKADQVISGTALNLFAPAFCIFIARAMFGAKQINFVDTFHITEVPVLGKIPVLGTLFFKNCYLSSLIGIILLVIVAFIFKKTRFGKQLSACGENPEAAASVGIPVTRMRYTGVILSGVFAGMGGVIFIVTTSTKFAATVAGYGFLALAVLILGRWRPLLILLASFFFGLLKAVASGYSGIPFMAEMSIPSEVYKMMPYLLTLLILAVASGETKAPKALGKIYDDGGQHSAKNSKWKKVGILALVLAVVLGITAIFPKTDELKNAVSNGYGADLGLLVEYGSSVDDQGYIQTIWEGVIAESDDKGCTRKYYQAKDNSEESLFKTADIAAKGDASVIVGSSNVFGTVIGYAQKKYPDRLCVLFDSEPLNPETGEVEYAENTIAIFFAEEEAGFLAGYAAVKDGYRNLGYIGGMALSSVIRYGYGYLAGCEYAAKELNLKPGEVTVKYCYAGTFAPTPEVQAMASSWYHSGTDVIFACAGGAGDSVVKAAEQSQKYVIQVDLDRSADSETIITSAMKETQYSLRYVLDAYESGDLEAGQMVRLTVKDKCLSLPMATSRFKTFSQEDYDKICEVLAADAIDFPTPEEYASVSDIPFEHIIVTPVK